MRPAIKMVVATLAFSTIHSALASRQAKAIAARVLGEQRRDAYYRLFYTAQSLILFTSLVLYGARLPTRTIYRVTGLPAYGLKLGQLGGLIYLWHAARQVGIARLGGLENWKAKQDGRPIPAGPYAQGPEIQPDGELTVRGPFASCRHPLNLAGIPILWLTSHMTTRRLAFNLTSTLYFILGSLHEESRLKSAYGHLYLNYAQGATPFFWPRLIPTDSLRDSKHRQNAVQRAARHHLASDIENT